MKVRLPGVFAVQEKIGKNWIRQLAHKAEDVDAEVVRFVTEGADGFEVTSDNLPIRVQILRRAPLRPPALDEAAVLRCATVEIKDGVLDASSGTWLQHSLLPLASLGNKGVRLQSNSPNCSLTPSLCASFS